MRAAERLADLSAKLDEIILILATLAKQKAAKPKAKKAKKK